METFCRITMQPQLFELKLKAFPLLHRRDHFRSRVQVNFSSDYITLCRQNDFTRKTFYKIDQKTKNNNTTPIIIFYN